MIVPIDDEDTPDTVSCGECNSEINTDESFTTGNGEIVCDQCFSSCERCDWSGTDSDSWYTVQDRRWCESCWEDNSFYCDRCEETFDDDRTGSYNVNGSRWCEYCASDNASFCEDCDEYYSDDDESCPCGGGAGRIHQYSYKPNPAFHGQDPNGLFMGFELEMTFPNITNNLYSMAVSGVEPLEQDNVCYLKSDGSIEGTGFELVTHPHTLGSYEQATDLWNYIEHLRTNYGARSWDTESCGLHVHVSRAAFKSGAHTHRFLSLIYKNPREMMKLAGRKNSRFARFDDVYKPDEWGLPHFSLQEKIHRGYRTERYGAVNTNNDYTLELRFFRGNMKREGVMTALELCHASVEYTRDLSVSDVKLGMLKWEWFYDWVSANNGLYPNLYLRMSKVPSVSLDSKPLINA
jgi:hypothetical protein